MGAAQPHIATHVSQNTIAGADKLSTLTSHAIGAPTGWRTTLHQTRLHDDMAAYTPDTSIRQGQALQQQLQQDWARSQGDIRQDSGVPLSWLRGRSPVLPPQQFAARWQASGVLYTVVAGEGPRLCLPGFQG
jgi:hypothetical protein